MKKIELAGKRFGKWTVIERRDRSKWLCICDCGAQREVYGPSLTKGVSTNCGCVKKKHGYEGTKVYRLWSHMKERCFKEYHKSYKAYGGRGITVCDEWLDARTFIEWALNNGYEEGLTLDRIDVNGNYEPSNCRFVPNLKQQNNKRNNRFITIGGISKTLAEWAREAGIGPKVLRHRVEVGWPEDKLLTPIKNSKGGG